MNSFKLVQHNVISASFTENTEREKKKDIDISVEGGILIPKDLEKTKYLVVQLKLNFGKPDERLYLILETKSRFEVQKDGHEISEEEVRSKCLPIALSELRKTVKKVTEAYGIPVVDLPPFKEEIENE